MKFKNDRHRRAAFANMNSGSNLIRKNKRGGYEPKNIRTDQAPIHQKAVSKLKKLPIEISMPRIIPHDYDFYISAGKKTLPFLSTSILGVPISTTVANATFNSIEDSYKFYKQSNNIDDALFIGMKSFVNNYAKNFTIEYLQNNLHKKDDDDIFDDVLEGTIILSSIVIDSFF